MSLCRCFSSLGCAGLSLDETLALAEKHGIPLLELRALGGTVELPGYFSALYGSPANLAARIRASRVRVVALDASLRLVGATQIERKQFTAFVPWAEALGVQRIRVFDGGKTADPAEITSARETLGWWTTLRKERGWRTELMVETHDSLYTSEAILRFVTAFPGTAILWDAHHTWRKGGEDPVLTWKAIRANVVHVHVKDSIDVPSVRHPYTYVLPGAGEFPIAPLRDVLRANGFTGPVSLEWEKLWHPYLPSLDQALATAAERQWW